MLLLITLSRGKEGSPIGRTLAVKVHHLIMK